MIDQSPAERHARVVGILKDRLAVVERQTPEPWGIYLCKDGAWEIDRPGEVIANRMPWNHNADQSQANGRALHAQRTERPAELQALIEIAERHSPRPRNADKCDWCVADGDDDWPCEDFLSVERAVYPCQADAKGSR